VIRHPTSRIKVTGHSLGAALALLGALDLEYLFPGRIATVYNFGQPRVGNLNFAMYADSRLQIYRVVHDSDIVATIPPPFFMLGYIHAGTQIWYTSDMSSYRECVPEDKRCMVSLPAALKDKKGMGDHSLEYYLRIPVFRG
jgi:predicted lipase